MQPAYEGTRPTHWIFRSKQIAAHTGSRGSGNNVLMGGEARPLVGLEHPIAKGIARPIEKYGATSAGCTYLNCGFGGGQLELVVVAVHCDLVRPIHLAAVVHGEEREMAMIEIVDSEGSCLSCPD